MRYRIFEANYLISLLSSILNQRTPPNPVRATDWRELFYLAEYHDITNIACYALIAVFDKVPEVWKNRFFKSFRKCVSDASTQEKEFKLVLEGLEYCQIDYILINGWLIRDYYPQPDMRVVEDIELLVSPDDEKDIRKLMEKLGYHYEGRNSQGKMAYFKSINSRVVFYQKLFPDNRKLRTHFAKIWKQAKLLSVDSSQYLLNIDDYYIYLIAMTCDAYAKEEIDARYIIDLYLYRKKHEEQMNQTYIDENLVRLELDKMARYLEDIGQLWFGVYEGENAQNCKDIEEYIWSKGSYGRDISIKMLPMILDMQVWMIRDQRREKVKKILNWFFPSPSYMRSSFPIVDKVRILLPLLWIFRLLWMGFSYIRIKIIHINRIMTLKSHERELQKLEDKKQEQEANKRQDQREGELQKSLKKEAEELFTNTGREG